LPGPRTGGPLQGLPFDAGTWSVGSNPRPDVRGPRPFKPTTRRGPRSLPPFFPRRGPTPGVGNTLVGSILAYWPRSMARRRGASSPRVEASSRPGQAAAPGIAVTLSFSPSGQGPRRVSCPSRVLRSPPGRAPRGWPLATRPAAAPSRAGRPPQPRGVSPHQNPGEQNPLNAPLFISVTSWSACRRRRGAYRCWAATADLCPSGTSADQVPAGRSLG